MIEIGKITGAVGLKGEVKVYNYSTKDRFDDLDYVYVAGKSEEPKYTIQNVRYQKNMVVLKLEGIDDRNQAEAMKNSLVCIENTQLRKLPEGEFYIKDLIGLDVIDVATNNKLGILKDVLQNTAQDVYVIKRPSGKEFLVPAVKQFVKEIDLETGIKLELIPGFIDEES